MSTNRSQQHAAWIYDLLSTTQDKTASRTSVREPDSYELIGVDGQLGGGLRPFPGLRLIHEMPFDLMGSLGSQDGSSQVLDLFPFEIVVGDSSYGYGFVYRMRKGAATTSTLYLDMYVESVSSWQHRGRLLKTGMPLDPVTDPVGGKQMSVSAFGRLLYLFIEDEEPITIEVNKVTGAVVITSDTGPGRRPRLFSPEEDAGALGVELDDYIQDSRSGTANLVLTEFLPSELVGLGLGDGTSTSDPGRIGQRDTDVHKLQPGDYAFAYFLYNSETGRRTSLSKIAQVRRRDFSPLVYGSGSGAASGSAIDTSAVPLYAAVQIDYDSGKYDQAYMFRSVKVQDAGGTFVASIIHLEAIIDLDEFGTDNNGAAPYDAVNGKRQAIYYYELEDKQLVFQDTFQDYAAIDEDMPRGGSALWYENTMLVSKISIQRPSSGEENRKTDVLNGLGELRWSSLVEISPEIFAPEARYLPSNIADDILTMHRAGPNVIGFSLNRQYLIRKEGEFMKVLEMHEGYGVVGQKAAAAVGTTVYFVTTKGLKTVDSQMQLDDVRAMDSVIVDRWGRADMSGVSVAYDATASVLIVFNPVFGEAILFWFSTGRVTELRDLGYVAEVVSGSWPKNFFWNRADMTPPFSPGTGNGLGEESYKNPLSQRAFFVVNPPKDSVSEVTACTRIRIYMIDSEYSKLQKSNNWITSDLLDAPLDGEREITTFEHPGVGLYAVRTTPLASDLRLYVHDSMGTDLPEDVWGLKLYVSYAANPSLIGQSAYIKRRHATNLDTLVLGGGLTDLSSLVPGDIVSISPILFKWVGSPLRPETEEGDPFSKPADFFTQRRASSLGAAFTDVAGTALTLLPEGLSERKPVCTFKGGIYRGNADLPAEEHPVFDNDGTVHEAISEAHESSYFVQFGRSESGAFTGVDGAILVPSVTVAVSNLDFRLVSVLVSGKMLSQTRTGRSSP